MKGSGDDSGDATCSIARALQLIGDRWSLLIIREAFQGLQHFNEFQKSLGLAKNILSARLKKLVEGGVFEIHPDAETAVSHRYVLTPRGEQLGVVLVALWQWGAKNCFLDGELKVEMVDSLYEKPLALLNLSSRDGRVLGPRDFRLVKRTTRQSSAKCA